MKIESTFNYFDQLRAKMQIEAYNRIAPFWKKKVQAMQNKSII